MAGLNLDWGKESKMGEALAELKKNPAGPNKLATTVINTRNPKVGVSTSTYAAQISCPNGENTNYRCPLYGNGCYAEELPIGWTTKRLNKDAGLQSYSDPNAKFSPLDVAMDEAESMNQTHKSWLRKKKNNWVRLHVVGDSVTSECAKIVSSAAESYVASSGVAGAKNVWNYTHAWRTVPRDAWSSKISVLASCDRVEDLPKAHSKGYATAIVLPQEFMEELGRQQSAKFGKSFMLPNGFKAIPCPYEIAKLVPGAKKRQCVECHLCMRDEWLRDSKCVIAFAAHTSKAEVVSSDLIRISAEDTKAVEDSVKMNPNPGRVPHTHFKQLVRKFEERGDVDSPESLAAWIERKKHGKGWPHRTNPGFSVSSESSGSSVGNANKANEALTRAGRVYYPTQGSAISAVERSLREAGYDWNSWDVSWDSIGYEQSRTYGPIHLGDNHYLNVTIYRMGSGNYELTAAVSKSRRGSKRNPEDTAAEMYETFHGKPSEEILEVGETVRFHENLAALGELVEMKVATLTKKDVELDFTDSGCMLCSNENGTQLYVVGGDQSIDLDKIGFTGAKGEKDLITIGVLYELTYRTEKGFDKFKLTDYYHELGEETGFQPMLVYDAMNEFILISGGEYKIKAEGIVN
jgi:hypothetical protein